MIFSIRTIRWIKKILKVLPAFFWLILIFGFGEADVSIITLISALLHEMGHIGYLCAKKKTTLSIRGVLSGFRIRSTTLLSYEEERLFYLAGPLVNLFCFIIASFLSRIFGDIFSVFAMINLFCALSNLLPIEGYDGYGILRASLQKLEKGELFVQILSAISTCLIFFLCIISLYFINKFNGGYWIFFVFFISMIKRFKEDLH